MSYSFRPAKSFTEQHGIFVGIVGGTNSGKSWSSMRLAQGIATATGKKVAALDTEGGRLLHLKDHFDFDVMVLRPPHSPTRYLEAAQVAEDAGYGALLIDSFSQAWRGVGGVLDATDTKLKTLLDRRRALHKQKGWDFDEAKERDKLKSSASIESQMAWAMMVNGFLGLRIPLIFSIRGGMTYDPEKKTERFKAQCKLTFPYELTVSFRLAQDRKGIIDLSDPTSWKMDGAHQGIFHHDDLISEEHGAKLVQWARGHVAEPSAKKRTWSDVLADLRQLADDAANEAEIESLRGHDIVRLVMDKGAENVRKEAEKILRDAAERFVPGIEDEAA